VVVDRIVVELLPIVDEAGVDVRSTFGRWTPPPPKQSTARTPREEVLEAVRKYALSSGAS